MPDKVFSLNLMLKYVRSS